MFANAFDASCDVTPDETPGLTLTLRGTSDLEIQIGNERYFAVFVFPHTGKLSCFLAGISTCLFFSIASARARRRRVECGMMTSSI